MKKKLLMKNFCLLKIIENKDGCATRRIFNLGNPDNDASIEELANLLVDLIKTYPAYREIAEKVRITPVDSGDHHRHGGHRRHDPQAACQSPR